MKALALCLLVLSLSACNPAYDNPPMLHAAAKAAVHAPLHGH